MELTIGNYRITSDPLNFVVEERKVVKNGDNKGNEYWTAISYHSSLQQACTWLLKRRISDSDAATLFTLSKEIDKATRQIVEAVSKREREVRLV